MDPNARQYFEMVDAGKRDKRSLVQVEIFNASKLGESNQTLKPSSTWIHAIDDPNAKYAVITLTDPGSLNSLSMMLMVQLHEAILALTRDPKVKVVILTGQDPAFCSGGHLSMIANGARAVHETITDQNTPGGGTAEPWRWIRMQFGGVARLIANSNTLFVAAVNGSAAGVGLAFALACDVIIASEKARFVPAFGKLGLVPEVGTSFFLTRKLGYQGALNFFLEGRSITGREALQLGICQQCVPHDELLNAAQQWTKNALSMPSHALEMTKSLLRSVMDVTFESSLRMEEFAEANCFSTRALPISAERILKKGNL